LPTGLLKRITKLQAPQRGRGSRAVAPHLSAEKHRSEC